MKFVLFLLCLLAFAFSIDEEGFDYSEYYNEYGCSLSQTQKCCWTNYDKCCAPATGPRTCEEKRTICCKRKSYNMGSGSYVIFFYHS